jgi:hypothetical protein
MLAEALLPRPAATRNQRGAEANRSLALSAELWHSYLAQELNAPVTETKEQIHGN